MTTLKQEQVGAVRSGKSMGMSCWRVLYCRCSSCDGLYWRKWTSNLDLPTGLCPSCHLARLHPWRKYPGNVGE